MPGSTTRPAIEISDLVVRRGRNEVLHALNLSVTSGSITGLLGPSGCGKTTLMRAIVGTQIVESGSVTVLGEPAGSASLRRRVGYVTQSPTVYLDLSVRDNVRYFAALYGRPAAAAAEAIDAVALGGYSDQQAGQLSGGQRARVSLACALVGNPELLILDEPTVGLDPVLRADLWDQFADLAAAGTTLLVSSHVMDEAEHCPELLLMREGSLIAQLSPDELRTETGQSSLEHAFLTLIRTRTVGAQQS
ncbi:MULTISPECIES: ABC transporter ATP-binding protein [Rhodococcus]|uniref:ABC transporter ATP-binding protein n=1 Tax=Rhodococcus TaxID=1827 RepID=UPI000BCB9E78|nr:MULTISPECIES: ABC transporter ATP-binding protein [Rhodococcus]MBP1159029.1 ABC-2 type transport system ATP-binding protein [Rhodococcus sp. PvR099]MCZ4558494.1 ABC transporter ATP-binding protein [Rhodococcus maanshanensis]PTR39098.1 ABC-2 type transport system ATP-binding protein [Rhodococcus sp. OK611]SNX92884.1 ABC-2 type transport system ATP-binding protein [Rhodococcus sp. OK270]